MEIKDLNDFYIDLDGDIKATVEGSLLSEFLTTENKLNSEYITSKSIDEIKEVVFKINPNFIFFFEPYKQYSIKKDINGIVKGIKVYSDCNNVSPLGGGVRTILIGFDINSDGFNIEYYFIGDLGSVYNIIKRANIMYEVLNFHSHKPILHSVKYSQDLSKVINFKTYYARGNVDYSMDLVINKIKQIVKF